MKHFFFTVILASLLSLLCGTTVEASCCSSASTGGIGRLLSHERALVEMANNARYIYGSFDSNAQFSSGHIPHLPHLIVEPEIQVMARLFDFFEPFVRIPVRIQTSEKRTRGGLADITVGARIPVFKENLYYAWPSLTFLTSLRMPSGTNTTSNEALTNEDITSAGEWLISLGILLEKEIYGITYGIGYSFSAATEYLANQSQKPAATHAPLLTMGYPLQDHNSISLSIAPTFYTKEIADRKSIAKSDRRKITVAFGYTMNLHSHIKISANVGSDIPISYLGKNFNNEVFLRLSMRFGVY